MRSNDIDNITDRHNNTQRITGLAMAITQPLLMCSTLFLFFIYEIFLVMFCTALHCLQNIFSFQKIFSFSGKVSLHSRVLVAII